MNDHFFVLMYATSGEERNVTRFASYTNVQDVVDMVNDWLTKCCYMDCYLPGEQEETLKAQNGGELPETAFQCPEVKTPADLEKYNGFYDYESLGMFNLFLTPVYDTATAKKFCGGMNKEFGIDQEYSDQADRMLEHMDTLVKSFEEPGTDYAAAEEAIRTFLMQGGFSLFDEFGEEVPDTIVIPAGGFQKIDDPTV